MFIDPDGERDTFFFEKLFPLMFFFFVFSFRVFSIFLLFPSNFFSLLARAFENLNEMTRES